MDNSSLTYKKMNADLSEKVQSLNAELSVHKQKIEQLRAENQEQHEKIVKYRQYCRTINTQCMTFINSITNLVQNFVDDDPIIEINPRTANSESPEDVTLIQQIQTPKRPEIVRPQLHNGLNSDENVDNNVLNTILEESNVGPFTSTPVVPNRLVNSAPLLPAITPVQHLSPVQHSSPSSTDSSSNDEIDQTVIEVQRMQVNNRLSRRISVNETTHQHNLTTKPVNTDSPDYESFDDESTMGNSQSTSINSRGLKRKGIENTRPLRKTRPDPGFYKERSLLPKLRRPT